MNVGEILKKFISEELDKKLKVDNLKEDDSLLESGIIDSVNMMILLTFIEDKFRIKIKDDELIPENFETIHSIRILIEEKFK